MIAVTVASLALLGLASSSDLHRSHRCDTCCHSLAHTLPGRVDYFNDTIYAAEQIYWSAQQSHTLPRCRFTPQCADDVSKAMKAIRDTGCQFAVKSGGHAAFDGASNIQDGITIDLRGLKSIAVSADRKTTAVGTGNHWDDVYKHLDPLNLAVIGGRNGDIGVGGLTLGGGISFFSGFHGWACDNVKNYEVVLADGRIVNANAHEHPDLYFALRGGGNNFGIVTRMDLDTFDHGLMWGGATVYPITANVSIYDAFYWFNKNAAQDPKAALIVAAACISGYGCVFSNDYEYIDPTPQPPIFENFTSIKNVSDTTRVTNLLNLTDELKATQPNGFRQIFITATFENDAQLLTDILEIWLEDIKPIANITSFLPALVFQPITEAVISNFGKKGGNALGVTGHKGPLTLMDIDFQWGDSKDDQQAISIAEGVIAKSIALAKSRGLANDYIYQNYAYKTQDVFSGYGKANKKRLIEISKKYDPEQVFQVLQPGYFNLGK